MHLFVYYKLMPNQIPNLLSIINQLFDEVKKKYPSINTQVLKRVELNKEGMETWMESYILEDDSQEQALKEFLNQLVFEYSLPTTRHYEVFIEA